MKHYTKCFFCILNLYNTNFFFFSAGKDVTLKDVDTDVETYDTRRPRPKFRRAQRFRSRRRRTVSEGGGAESQTDNNGGDNNRERQSRRYTRTRRFFRTRRTPQSETRANENGNTVSHRESLKKYILRVLNRENRVDILYCIYKQFFKHVRN